MAEMIAGAAAGPLYPKVNGIWKRRENGHVIIGDYATPELHYLRHGQWMWTEKIDGTNIRVHYDGFGNVLIGGKSDAAQIPAQLAENIKQSPLYNPDVWRAKFGVGGAVTVYGEGFGPGIQSGGAYGAEQRFIVFDVFVHDAADNPRMSGWWLAQNQVEDVALSFGAPVVPYFGTTHNLESAEALVRHNLDEFVSSFDGVQIEGLVGRPTVPMFDRRGHRIMVKIKRADYKHIKREDKAQ